MFFLWQQGNAMWPVPACSIFIAEPFLNEYYTDLEFLMVFMNIFLYKYIF